MGYVRWLGERDEKVESEMCCRRRYKKVESGMHIAEICRRLTKYSYLVWY